MKNESGLERNSGSYGREIGPRLPLFAIISCDFHFSRKKNGSFSAIALIHSFRVLSNRSI